MFIKSGVILTVLLCFGDITKSSPITNDGSVEATVTSTQNTTTTTTQKPTVTAVIIEETLDQTDSKAKARECTLNALQAIVLNTGEQLDEECKTILRAMIKNAGKRKEDKQLGNDADLRKELKELALKEKSFDNINDEIDQAETMMSEKRLEDTEASLEEPKSDDIETRDNPDTEKSNTKVDKQVETPVVSAELDTSEANSDKNGFRGGDFLIDNSGIGLLGAPDSENKDNIDDDFLIIPLRFLRKEMAKKHKVERETERSSEIASKHYDRKPIDTGDDDVAAKWLLRSILDMLSKDRDQKIDEPELESKSENGMNEKARDDSDYEKENGDSMKRVRELNSGILARVESDISQLGKDLRQLQYANNY